MVFDKNYEALCLYAVKVYRGFLGGGGHSAGVVCTFLGNVRDRLTTENARPLLYRITRNMCVDRVREKPKSIVDVGNDRPVGILFSPESENDSKIDLLMEAVKNLPVKCQQVLVAICFNEKNIKTWRRKCKSLLIPLRPSWQGL